MVLPRLEILAWGICSIKIVIPLPMRESQDLTNIRLVGICISCPSSGWQIAVGTPLYAPPEQLENILAHKGNQHISNRISVKVVLWIQPSFVLGRDLQFGTDHLRDALPSYVHIHGKDWVFRQSPCWSVTFAKRPIVFQAINPALFGCRYWTLADLRCLFSSI